MRRLSILFGMIVSCGMVWCTVACGVEVHRFTSSFGHEGSGPGEFLGPHGVAVDAESHAVYVVDEGNRRVQKFDPTGASVLCELVPGGGFVDPTEIAVDNSENPLDPSRGDVYVVDRGAGRVDKFNASCGDEHFELLGSESHKFEPGDGNRLTIEGIAVARNGNVWVSVNKGPLFEFDDAMENRSLGEIELNIGTAFGGIGVDAEEDVYFGAPGGLSAVAKVTPAGETVEHPFCGVPNVVAAAVDSTGGEAYLDLGGSVVACRVDGTPIEEDGSSVAIIGSVGDGLLSFSLALAVDEADGNLYVSDQRTDKIYLFEALLLPTVTLSELSGRSPRGVTLNGTVNPEGRDVTACRFEYTDREAYIKTGNLASDVACATSGVGAGSTPVDVSAQLEHLVPGGEYCYRLTAENAAAVASHTAVKCLVTGPLVTKEFVTDVTSGSTVLHATVDPNGADTHYYVEYGTSEGYGSYLPIGPPGVDLGAGIDDQSLTVHLQGLQSATAYHYRFVAIQDGEVLEERPVGDHVFVTRTDVAQGVADGREWELVSPVDKKGGLIELFQQGGQVQASSDGSGIAYVTTGSSVGEDPAGKPTYSPVVSRRTGSGWISRDMSLPGRLPENEDEVAGAVDGFLFEYKLFSADLSEAVIEPQINGTPPLAPGVTERTLYLQGGSAFEPLVWPEDVPSGTTIEENSYGGEVSEWKMTFLAASPDLSHVLFKTPMALTNEAVDEEHVGKYVPTHVQWNLYVWSNGELKLVNVLPENGGVAHGRYPVPTVKPAGMGHAGGRARGGAPRVMSDDGRFVAWTWGEPYSEETRPFYRGLFLRDMAEERTVKVGGAQAVYQTMSSDGSKVFYLEARKLFVYEYATETTTDLTPGSGANVSETVSNVSSDGSYVYFVAGGALAGGAVEGEGDDNLYVAHEIEDKWSIAFIATLSNVDKPTWYAETFGAPLLPRIASRVSPDGRYLVFMSERPLTGYDNVDAVSGQSDEEVFLYDAATEALSCVSCDPTNARPAGVFDDGASELLVDREGVWTAKESSGNDPHSDHWLAGSVPGWDDLSRDPSTYQPRYLANSGRVFFDSPVGLVPGDTNGLEDVYEWEPLGVGGCGTAGGTGLIRSGEGCVGLISSGTASRESAFYDASESGDDVFFNGTGKLVGEDVDQGYDIYDAHICSSDVPCAVSSTPIPPCSSQYSCKGVTVGQPELFGAPPSETFNGQGNIVASNTKSAPKPRKKVSQTCKKNARKRGKCSKRPTPKKRAAKAKRAAHRAGHRDTKQGGGR